MDSIPFEKVTVQEAKAVADGPPVKVVEKNWTLARGKDSLNPDFTEEGWKWLDSLPPEVQPGGLVQLFPRIANKLAEIWNRPHQCERYLDALVLDNRGDRKGFPLDVAVELGKLKAYYLASVVMPKLDPLGQRIA